MGESAKLLREEIEGKRRLYDAFVSLLPRAENRLVDAGHVTMHLRRPDAVIQAIQDLQPRVLAGAILSAFDAAWAAWVADPGDRSLGEYMTEACDPVEGMTRPVLERGVARKR